MSTAQINGFKTALTGLRDDISQLPGQSAFTGNAMSSINACLDNLNCEVLRLEAEAKVIAEREAKNLEEARKVVAAADARAAAAGEAKAKEAEHPDEPSAS